MAAVLYIFPFIAYLTNIQCVKIYSSLDPDDWTFYGCVNTSVISNQCDVSKSFPTECVGICGYGSYITIPSMGYIQTSGYKDITVTYSIKAQNMNTEICRILYAYPSNNEWQYLDHITANYYRINTTKQLPSQIDDNFVAFLIQSDTTSTQRDAWCYLKYIRVDGIPISHHYNTSTTIQPSITPTINPTIYTTPKSSISPSISPTTPEPTTGIVKDFQYVNLFSQSRFEHVVKIQTQK